jgi:hypothetical protein
MYEIMISFPGKNWKHKHTNEVWQKVIALLSIEKSGVCVKEDWMANQLHGFVYELLPRCSH